MTRPPQNYSNHRHIVPVFHLLILGTLVVLFGISIYLVFSTKGNERLMSIMFMLLSVAIIGVALYCRSFALTVQDRAIRAEEKLRYYLLTGKPIDPAVTLRQLIALRFASDEEFVALTEKAVREKLRSNDIKKLVKNWRADYHRA